MAPIETIYALLAGRRAPADLPPAAWPRLLAVARPLRLLPLLADRIGAAPGLPAGVARDLGEARWASSAAALRRRALAAAAAGALDRAGVEAIVLKGWPLAASLYGDDSLRPSGDCDLLVRREDRPRASAALAAAGFRTVGHHAEIHAGRLGDVDLHVDLVNAERVPARAAAGLRTEAVWGRARRETIDGFSFRRLAPEDEVVYLAAHAVLHHGLGEPLLLVDLDLHLRRIGAGRGPAPADVAARAEELGGRRPLGLALEACRAALGTPVPPALEAGLPPPGRVERALIRRIVRRGGHPVDRYLFALLGMPWRDRPSFVRQAALPAPATLREVSAARLGWRPTPGLYLRHAATIATGCGNLLAALVDSALISGRPRA